MYFSERKMRKTFLIFGIIVHCGLMAQQDVCNAIGTLIQNRNTNFDKLKGASISSEKLEQKYASTILIKGALQTYFQDDFVSKASKYACVLQNSVKYEEALSKYNEVVFQLKSCSELSGFNFSEKIQSGEHFSTWLPKGENPAGSKMKLEVRLIKEFEIDSNLNSRDVYFVKLEFGN